MLFICALSNIELHVHSTEYCVIISGPLNSCFLVMKKPLRFLVKTVMNVVVFVSLIAVMLHVYVFNANAVL